MIELSEPSIIAPDDEQQSLVKIKEILTNYSGMDFQSFREKSLISFLNKRVLETGSSDLCVYLGRILKDRAFHNEELGNVLDEMTVNETWFFREPAHFDFLREKVYPNYTEQEDIHIISLGCSTGEEVYSLAMSALDFFHKNKTNVNVTGFDIDQKSINRARSGLFSEKGRNMKFFSEKTKSKYFTQDADQLQAQQELLQCTDFFKQNLANFSIPMLADVVFCRNVLIYFTEEKKKKIIEKIVRLIKNKGYFFMSMTEGLDSFPKEFRKIQFEGGTVFQKHA